MVVEVFDGSVSHPSRMSTLRQGLVARTEQRLALLPRMLQSIEILQLATADLVALIDAELEQNETLELVRPEAPLDEPRRQAAATDEDPKLALLQQAPDREKDLWTHVRDEVAMLDLSEEAAAGVLALAARLDAAGFLGEERAELIAELGPEGFDQALGTLCRIEPRGLGAAGPVEAMLFQLDAGDPDRPLIAELLEHHLDALARNRLPDVAAALGVDVDELEALLEKIGGLEPRPAARFSESPVPGIRPDVVVRRARGQVEVVVDDLALPVLHVSTDYARMARDVALPREVRSYLGGKLRSARDLIEAVESRKRTLCTVGAAVLAEQRGFLDHGRRAIRPLRMADIAARVGLHASTVSRAIAGKFLGSDHGVIALREFFDGGDGDSAHGRAAVLELIRDLVDAEDPRAPLADDQIAGRLAAHGVKVARRTVAKHRHALGIPSSALRRRHGGGS